MRNGSIWKEPCASAMHFSPMCVWMGCELKPRVSADLSVLNTAQLPVVINVLVRFPSSCVLPEENTGFAFPKGCSVPTVKLSWGSWVPRLCHDIFPSRCTAPTALACVPHEVSLRSLRAPHTSAEGLEAVLVWVPPLDVWIAFLLVPNVF